MPVSGNQEPGVLSQWTGLCSSAIPIKKRRIPFILPRSPPREDETPFLSKMNNAESKLESTEIDSSIVAKTSKDYIQKSDVINNSLKDVKKEIAADILASSIQSDLCTQSDVGSCPPMQLDVKKEVPLVLRGISGQNNADSGTPRDEAISPAAISGFVDTVDHNLCSLVNEISANHVVPNSKLNFPSVKEEMVNVQPSGDCKIDLSTALGNTMLSLASSELVASPFVNQKIDLSTKVPDKSDAPLLSLSLSEAKLPESSGADKTVTDSTVIMSSTDRSNWDLNTTMDAWEGSIEDASSNDTIGADELSSSSGTHDMKHFMSSTSVVNVRVDKGKRAMEPIEERSTLCIPSMSFKQFNAEESLRLSLSTSLPQYTPTVMPHMLLQRSIINSISSGSGIVKSEPVDENLKSDLSLVPCGTMESLNNRLVNKKSAESSEALKTLASNSRKLIEPTSFKYKVSQESNQETHIATKITQEQRKGSTVHHQESCSSSSTVVSGSTTPRQPCVSKLTICSELSGCNGVLDQSKDDSKTTCIKIKDNMGPSICSPMLEPVNNYREDPNVCNDDRVNSSAAMTSSLQISFKNDTEINNTNTEESASDKEKISAMVKRDTYGSDFESDGNHAAVCQMRTDVGQCEKVDDDYEDGEVRELKGKSSGEQPICEGMLSANIAEVDDGCRVGVPTDQSTISERHSDNEENYERTELMTNQLVSDYGSLPATISENKLSVQTEPMVPGKSPVYLSVEEKVPCVNENELMSDKEINMKDMVLATVSVARNENDKGSNEVGMKNGINLDGVLNSSLSKEEVSNNEHGSFKDSASGGNRSRIITLPRASDSPSRMRSLSGRAFQMWSGRERYGDVDGDNIRYRGHRDDTYGDGSRKFTRDQSFRNSRMDFKRDTGRGTGRLESLQNKWDPEHDFPSRSFDVSAEYRFNRNGHASAVSDNDIMSNDFVTPDGTRPNAGRIGRKPLIGEFHSFRQPSSRRLSPGSRDGAAIKSLPNLRRIPESGSDLPGLRHEKFLRGLPDDISSSVYSRPQASYHEMSGQFVRGNQGYSTVQRRTFTHARSKSPVRTQARSPGSWPSSRGRFNDDCNNPSDQIQHRSVMYKVERMRSPDHGCYTDDLGDRRRVSPNYVSRRTNEMRDSDFAREHGHSGSLSSTRSPSDRVITRTTRRLDVVDTRERTASDEYFSGPIHSGRFHEFRDDRNDERRKFGERRRQFQPSRPSYSVGNENHRFNAEDGSNSHRFCLDQDTDSLGRSNVRQRDFHGAAKPRPLIAQRQIRNSEDQEGSFGQTAQGWHDESFSDDSRMKRRRF